jgi:hypothetical protein
LAIHFGPENSKDGPFCEKKRDQTLRRIGVENLNPLAQVGRAAAAQSLPLPLAIQHKMPSLEVDDYGVKPVISLVTFFEEALEAATAIKPTSAIDPPLEDADLKAVLDRLPTTSTTDESQDVAASRQQRHHRFAVIETAARGVLSNLIVRHPSTFWFKTWVN